VSTGSQALLARLGFADAARVEQLLGPGGLGLLDGCPPAGAPAAAAPPPLLAALAGAADPDLAVSGLVRLLEAQRGPQARETGHSGAELLDALAADAGLRARLAAVLGASTALADHLSAQPGDWRLLASAPGGPQPPAAPRRRLLAAVGASPDDPVPVAAAGQPAVEGLRLAYRRALLDLAARDLTGGLSVEAVADELSDLAAATLDAALAVGRADLGAGQPPCRLAVIGMGKCGGRELNYVSDVDVIFVAEAVGAGGGDDEPAALRAAAALAAAMIRVCAAVAWPVDAALRPEGRDGPLVRTLASHEAYYRRWARTWEFQALLKARPVAGDAELGAAYLDRIGPLVWRAAEREHFVDEVRAMRRRVESTLPARDREREIKLGPGGLRDVEFAVQLLQLVHGRADESLRSGATLPALRALAAGGYVGRADAATLADSYRWLRTVEHRLQLQRLRRTHRIPTEPSALRWLAQALGYRGRPEATAVEAFEADRARHAREVRRLHEKLFYRPLLESVARVPTDELRLSAEAARARLQVLGFADPAGALRHLQALTAGMTRTAAIQRALLPAMLGAFADAADPDAGLLAYRQVSEALGRTPWFLRLLRDEGQVADRLAHLLGSSRYVAELLVRAPEALRLLAGDTELRPRPADQLRGAMLAAARRATGWESAVHAARGLRRAELLRVACADLLGQLDVEEVGGALSDIADAVLAAALETAGREVAASRGEQLPVRLAVIAMGRLGGREAGYGSDADVLFVHEALGGAAEGPAAAVAREVAEELRRLLALPGPDAALQVDADLRPEGRQGPLSRSLASYAAYYRRWASVWEAQALLRARAVAGDDDLGRRFIELIDRFRYPPEGLAGRDVVEIRRLKARVDAERLPRGADPATHTKLGRGGLADVEWTVQLLQLRHAGRLPALRTTGTLPALHAAAAAGLLAAEDSAALAAAWRLATRVRNARMLVRGRPGDQLPRRGRELTGVARAVGYPAGRDPGEFVDEYLRTARRARAAVERVFYA